MAELIPSNVQKVFARVYHESRTISPTQLVVAVESHVGHGEGAEVELLAASAAVPKAVTMDTRGKTLLERVEPILSNLEKKFTNNPNFETVYRGSDGKISSRTCRKNHEGSGRGVGAGKVSAGCEGQVAACGELEG